MILTALMLAVAAPQTSPPPPAPPKVDCADADHRAFDFWLGEWDVYDAASKTLVAHSRIEKIVGCAISETYDQFRGPQGQKADYHGRSISSYVPADKNWRQFYTDNGGTAATMTGGASDGAMVLGYSYGPVTNRMTLKPNPDGSVRQHGEVSTDGGKTWAPAYDFIYRRSDAVTGVVNIVTVRTYTGIPTRKAPRKRRK